MLDSISPTSVPVGSPGFTLTLYGWGFTSGMQVYVNNVAVSSTYVNSNQITVFVPASNLKDLVTSH